MSQYQPQPPPGWGQPQPPQQPKKNSAGKIVGFSCLGIIAALLLIGGCAALVTSGTDTSSNGGSDKPAAQEQPKDQPADGGEEAKEEPAPESPIKIEAKKTDFTPGVLHSGGDFTSVKITVTNNSDENVDVNPLAFAITDTGGTKHPTDALGEDENQIDTLTLAPGENTTGAITAEGAFEPDTVTFTEDIFGGDPIKADVK